MSCISPCAPLRTPRAGVIGGFGGHHLAHELWVEREARGEARDERIVGPRDLAFDAHRASGPCRGRGSQAGEVRAEPCRRYPQVAVGIERGPGASQLRGVAAPGQGHEADAHPGAAAGKEQP